MVVIVVLFGDWKFQWIDFVVLGFVRILKYLFLIVLDKCMRRIILVLTQIWGYPSPEPEIITFLNNNAQQGLLCKDIGMDNQGCSHKQA